MSKDSHYANSSLDVNKIIADVVDRNIEKMLESLTGFAKNKVKKASIDLKFAFRTYLERSFRKYSTVKTLIYKTEPKYLYDFFQNTTLALQSQKIPTTDVNNILKISKNIIIEGAGGIGKSTLMKHLFINELQKNDLIPIFIEMKDLSSDITLLDFLFQTLQTFGFSLEKKYFEYALKSGCFLILFDGYDELYNTKNGTINNEIIHLSDRYCDNSFIIASRPNESLLGFLRFTILKALPLTKEQACKLITKVDYDIEVKSRFLEQLSQKLYDKHLSFASNPLLLTIMLLTFENYADIPDKLHIFYSNAFETLFLKHDATKSGYRREMKSHLPMDVFRSIFAEFCFKTYIQGIYQFSYSDLLDILKNCKRSFSFESEDFIFDLENSVCLIYQDGTRYEFTHRSFQEYFATLYIKDMPDDHQRKVGYHLIEKSDNNMAEAAILPMLFDMIQDRVEKNIIFPILKEIEASLSDDDDRFDEFAKFLFSDIGFVRLLDKNGNPTNYHLNVKTNSKKSRYLYSTLKYYSQNNYAQLNTQDSSTLNILFHSLVEKGVIPEPESYNQVIISIAKALSIPEIKNTFKKSWAGAKVRTASSLYRHLSKKIKNIQNSLNELLSF